MDWVSLAIGIGVGGGAGFVLGMLLSKLSMASKLAQAEEKARRLAEVEIDLRDRVHMVSNLDKELAGMKVELESLKKSSEEKLSYIEDARNRLADTFKALAADALKGSSETFLKLATATLEKSHVEGRTDLDKRQKAIEDMVTPLKDTLARFDKQVLTMEKDRIDAYGGLKNQTKAIQESLLKLDSETSSLVKALRAPQVRGRWGEVTLKRVAELAGMVEHCDFYEQESVTTEGGRLRPDMVVRMPNNLTVIVDAKVPLKAFLDASETTDEKEIEACLESHAKHVRDHMNSLSKKEYHDAFDESPLFVVLFLPGESFFRPAVEKYPEIIEEGMRKKVIIATPSTLITLLLTVAHAWRQETLSQNTQEIRDLGKQLYERLSAFAGHFDDLQKALEKSVDAYNSAVGSLERRVLVSARKFKELGAAPSGELVELKSIDTRLRKLQSDESGDEAG